MRRRVFILHPRGGSGSNLSPSGGLWMMEGRGEQWSLRQSLGSLPAQPWPRVTKSRADFVQHTRLPQRCAALGTSCQHAAAAGAVCQPCHHVQHVWEPTLCPGCALPVPMHVFLRGVFVSWPVHIFMVTHRIMFIFILP